MDDTAARCVGPGCGRPLARASTGRPARYCGDNCRQAAHRAKVRAAEEAAARAARLAEAKAATGRLWRPLEAAGFRDVGEHAALVASCAADLARPRRELDQALAVLHQAVVHLAGLARQYRDAADTARELTDVS
jgi:hypothetical protein